MSEFEDQQRALDAARADLARADHAVVVARERGQQIGRRLDALQRSRDDDDRSLAALREERDRLAAGDADRRGARDRAAAAAAAARALFDRFTDPREQLSRFDDRHPILLLPVRLETRFKANPQPGGPPQLWVRVYPDDVAVDTFEDLIAEVEARNARSYWTSIWQAGGVDAERRSAWATLASAHGAGRAFWIQQQLKPLNAEPVKAAGELLLVIASDDPLPAAEQAAAATYWRAYWLAAGDAPKIAAAFTALTAAVGAARAAVVRDRYQPANIDQRPSPAPASVRVVFLDLPRDEDLAMQQRPWTRPARASVLPERFVLLGYNGTARTLEAIGRPVPPDLVLGPDPSASAADQIHLEDDGELKVPDGLRWMIDFETALDNGMAFRVDLTPAQARHGFDELLVLGVVLGADAAAGATRLETLMQHHQASRKGFSLALQGTPTNNTEADPSGYTWRGDADVSYEHYFGTADKSDPIDARDKRDGRWLAEIVGVDPEVLKASVNYYADDQRDARAMNAALWPATLGYFMDNMMAPVFGDGTIEQTRTFFTQFVSARGPIPAIRIGAQPYGILPATAYSRLAWFRRFDQDQRLDAVLGIRNSGGFVSALYDLLQIAYQDWLKMAANVAYVGKPDTDPHQALLDIVGLHPTSAEFFNRFAESEDQLVNHFRFFAVASAFVQTMTAETYRKTGLDLLATLGFTPAGPKEVPEILSKFFLSNADVLNGPVIDDRPLSETDPIRVWRGDGTNYLEWLAAAARTSHDALRKQEGFIDDRPPSALLYLLLQHALDLSYLDVGVQLYVSAALMTPAQAKTARQDPAFIHVQTPAADVGSPWQHLYKPEPAITGHPTRLISDFIPSILVGQHPYLQTQLEAIDRLAHAPTARLERALAEHVDCCAYRLDAWWMGLVSAQLALMRTADEQGVPSRGVYLGAFGRVEDLGPENKTFEPVELAADLAKMFARADEPPVMRDRTNAGHILSPSLNHALTASILRNGYLSNATPAQPETLAVNLTSERVRLALGVIEGIRNGQPLSALLGYRLERGLHDREGLFLDAIIFDLRKAFPLVAGKTGTTAPTDPTVPIEALEARNVVDGLALVRQIQQSGIKTYPFGAAGLPAITDPTKLDAVNAEVERILDLNDAVADVAIAESVHQVVQGNYGRAAGTFDAYSKGAFPPIPEVVQTPRSGVALTHRVGLHLQAGLDPTNPARLTPRSKGEPAIDAWLAGVLPPLTDIVCRVEYFDAAAATLKRPAVSAADLGLMPIDVLYLGALDGAQAMTALDDLLVHHILTTAPVRADADVTLVYTELVDGKITFFELAPLVRSLRALLLRSRSLRATDLRLQQEARKTEEAGSELRAVKITTVRAELQSVLATWTGVAAALDATLTGPNDATVVTNSVRDIETNLVAFVGAARELSLFGFLNPGVGASHQWRKAQFAAAVSALDALINRWAARLAAFDKAVIDYNALDVSTPEVDRIATLATIERMLSTAPLQPPPATSLLFLTHVGTVVKPAFVLVLGQLQALLATANDLTTLHQGLAARAAGIAAHDAVPFSVDGERGEIRRYTEELKSRAEQAVADVTDRIAKANDLLTASSTLPLVERIAPLTEAARRLLDPDFVVLSEFTIGGDAVGELTNAFADRASLLDYLATDLHKDEPVDEWLYGVARVRDKLKQFEAAVMLGEALSGASLDLVPLQLPYRSPDLWLGLEYPDTLPGTTTPFPIAEDKLLYTAHFSSGFDASKPQCGVLLDEWTEVVPDRNETAGLAFHYDRPNTEPPQTLLLATPADFTGAWRWDDLVDAVRETFVLARTRAVEPSEIDATAYARFVPAILSSVTTWPVMQSLNFAFMNDIQFREP